MRKLATDLLVVIAASAVLAAAFVSIARWSDPDTPANRHACDVIQAAHPGDYC